MKNLLFLLAAGLFAGQAMSQELPLPSPFAKTEQVVGLTTISIEYSRPSVKGRTIFGDLVPYDEVWRLGANACTKFTTSTDLSIHGQTIIAGTYALFAIPQESGAWQVLFNTDTEQWGAGSYDAEKNVVVLDAKGVKNAHTETMNIAIVDITNNSAMMRITWADIILDIAIDVATDKIAEANIKAAIKKGEDLDKVYYKAASYYYKSLGDDKKALAYIQKGTVVKDGHTLEFLRAQILKDQGHDKEAIEYAEKAKALALESESKGWADYIQEHIESWKK